MKSARSHRIRFTVCKWTRRGHIYVASPESSYVLDLKICIDVQLNPGWEPVKSITRARTPLIPAQNTAHANDAAISVLANSKDLLYHGFSSLNRSWSMPLSFYHRCFTPAPVSIVTPYRRSRAEKRVEEKIKKAP